MGVPPAEGMTVDRRDNNKNYNPANCRWATRLAQARNSRKAHLIALDGEEHCLAEWSEITGILAGTIQWRLAHGWNHRRALTVPADTKKGRGD